MLSAINDVIVSVVLSEFQKILIREGGPLCRQHLERKHHHLCPPFECGKYHRWRTTAYQYDKSFFNGSETYDEEKNTIINSDTMVNDSINNKKKIVISVGHNGLGNQLFQHYFGYSLARHMNAQFYYSSIDMIPLEDHWKPPNTITGRRFVDLITDSAMNWDLLPRDHIARNICRHHHMSYQMRPVDLRDKKIMNTINKNIINFLDPNGDIRCLMSFGYFIERDVCEEDVRALWSKLYSYQEYFPTLNVTLNPTDIVFHLRCENSHPAYISHGK